MGKSNAARKEMDIIDIQSYEAGFASGYLEGIEVGREIGYRSCVVSRRKKARQRKQKAEELKRRRLYFLKQKLVGVLLLLFTIFAVWLLEGDATIALLTVPVSFMLIFSKEKMLVDRYFYETEFDEHKAEV